LFSLALILSKSDELVMSYSSEHFHFIYDLQNILNLLFVKTNSISQFFIYFMERKGNLLFISWHILQLILITFCQSSILSVLRCLYNNVGLTFIL
jgi:hypothetical protein